jgi:hypothetical protein
MGMYNHISFAVQVISAAVILVRTIQLGSHLTWSEWKGHPLQFIGMTLAYPMLMGGAVGFLLSREEGFTFLIAGVALVILSDRRRQ